MTRAVIVLVVAASLGVTTLRSQEPRFEVASLKERDRNTPVGVVGMQSAPGRLFNPCATLRTLVFYAFRRTWEAPVEGLPGWADTPCSDTDTANTYEFQATMPVGTSDADVRRMLQGFLVERFKLAFHLETRTLPVLALVVAPGGFKVKPTDPKDDPPRAPGSVGCPSDDRFCHILPMGSSSMAQIAGAIGFSLGRPVIDRTGLRGTYYVDLKWAGDASPNSSLPSLPTALKEQFGLELKPDVGPVEVLVIDRVEKPSPN